MPRSPKPLPVELDPSEHDLDLIELAEQRHALNVLVTEYDWLRAQELAELRGATSVSDIIRSALDRELNDAPERDHLRAVATRRLRDELAVRASRAAIDGLGVKGDTERDDERRGRRDVGGSRKSRR